VKALSHVRKEKKRKKERQRGLRLLRNTISSNPSLEEFPLSVFLLPALKDSAESALYTEKMIITGI